MAARQLLLPEEVAQYITASEMENYLFTLHFLHRLNKLDHIIQSPDKFLHIRSIGHSKIARRRECE